MAELATLDPALKVALADQASSPGAFAQAVTDFAEMDAPHLRLIDDLWVRVVNGERVLATLACPPQHGKAEADFTKVASVDATTGTVGWKCHGDLRVGDYVFGPDGMPTRVVGVFEEVTGLHYATGQEHAMAFGTLSHAQHEWTVRLDRKSGRFSTQETGWLFDRFRRMNEPRRPQLPDVSPLRIPEAELPIDPWVYGYWLGNGASADGQVVGHLEDRAEVERWLREAGYADLYEQPSFARMREGRSSLAFQARSPKLRFDLVAMRALCGHGREKRVDPRYLWASAPQRRALLQGLVDADGHVHPDGQVEFTSTSEGLVLDLRQLLVSLAYKPGRFEKKRAVLDGIDHGPAWRLTWYGTGCARTARRRENLAAPGRGRDSKGSHRYLHLEEHGIETGRCIQVERPDGLYLVGEDMLPTHNSQRLSKWGPSWALPRRPDLRIVIVSHAVSLARLFGRHARNLIEERPEFMGGLTIAEDRAAAHDFQLVGHEGGIYCVGVGGSLSGRPADVLILDDLLENQRDAESAEVKEHLWNWLQTVAFARLGPNASVLCVNCIVGDQRVLMADGRWVPIEDVRPGEMVARFDEGKGTLVEAEVLGQRSSGVDDVWKVRTGGATIECTDRHPFLVARKLVDARAPRRRENWEWCWKRADELVVGDVVALARRLDSGAPGSFTKTARFTRGWGGKWTPSTVHDREPEVADVDEDLAWLFGFFVGDGWVVRRGGQPVAVCIASSLYPDLNERARSLMERFLGRTTYHEKARYYRTESSVAARALADAGFGGNAHTKRVPEAVYQWPLACRQAFLRGLAEADGALVKGRPGDVHRIGLCNDDLAHDLMLLAMMSDVRPSGPWVSDKTVTLPSGKRADSHIVFFDLAFGLPADESLSLAPGACADGTMRFQRVREVGPTGERKEVFDLAVDGESFVCEGFTVHNTRWVEDDPIGRIHKEQPLVLAGGPGWEEITLPAIAVDDDPLGREVGDPLWADRYPLEWLEARRNTMTPEMWSAQYQGTPIEPSNSRFPSSMARSFRYTVDGSHVEVQDDAAATGWRPARILNRFSTVDLAVGLKRRHDWTVVSTWGVTEKADLLWLGMHRVRTEDHVGAITHEHGAYGGLHVNFIEAVGFQLTTVTSARSKGLPAMQAPGSDLDKVIRSDAARALWVTGKVFLPVTAPWRTEALSELALFPRAAHDDITDTLSYAALVLSKGLVTMGVATVSRADSSKKIPLRAIAGGRR